MKQLFAMALAVLLLPAMAAKAELPPAVAADSAVNVIVVRHAAKACSPVECDLTETGQAQAGKLRGQVATLDGEGYEIVDVFSSNACRTILTVSLIADDAGLPVHAYPAAEGIETCSYPGDGDDQKRPDADRAPANGFVTGKGALQGRSSVLDVIRGFAPLPGKKYVFVISDHSNHVCGWIEGLGVPAEEFNGEGNCTNGNLDESDYGDIFWLYDAGAAGTPEWHVEILEDAFDL